MREIIQEVWQETGLSEGIRHPLAYIMEACDDIAYSIIDAEDTVKKGYASFYDLMDHLENNSGNDKVVAEVVGYSKSKNHNFRSGDLSSRELNDISMQMFRVKAISSMVSAATDVFVSNIEKMMSGNLQPGFEIIENSTCSTLCRITKDFDRKHGFQHKDVLKLELQGSNHIKSMMTMLWKAVSNEDGKDRPFERYVYGAISENYRRVYKTSSPPKGAHSNYTKAQLICDSISGMTESYLIKKHNEFKALENASQ